ncbi:MAG: MFS transporter, partial [Firmicutes bacterium]|nr:MFS transporter [Bacillota bacterium]
EGKAENPLLALKLVRLRGFSVGYILMCGCYIVAAVIQTAIPFYLQQTKGVSTSVSGGIALIFTLTMVLLAPTFGSLSDRLGVRKIVLSGILCQSVFVFCYAMLNEKTPLVLVAVVLFLFGLGSAMFYSPNASAVMGSVPKENVGMASGMSSAVRSIATSIGQNVFSILIAWRTAAHATETLSEGMEFLEAQHETVLIMTGLLLVLLVTGFFLLPGRRGKENSTN